MIIKDKFSKREIELLKDINVDVDKKYNDEELEEVKEIVVDAMLSRLDKNQDFTPIALEYERILYTIIELEDILYDQKKHLQK